MRESLSLLCVLLLVTAQTAAQSTSSSSIVDQALAQQGQGGAIGGGDGGGDESGDDGASTYDPVPSSSGGDDGAWRVVAWLFAIIGGVMVFGDLEDVDPDERRTVRTLGWVSMIGFGTLALLPEDRQQSVPIPGTGLGFRPQRGGGAVTKGIAW